MFNKLVNKYLFEYSNATEAPPPVREDDPKRKVDHPPKREGDPPRRFDQPERRKRKQVKANATETAPPPTREKPSPTRKPSTSPTRTPSPIWAPSPGRKAQPKAIQSENEENYEDNEYVKAAMSKFKHRGP